MGPRTVLEADAEADFVDVEAAEVEVGLHLRAVPGTDFVTAEVAAAEFWISQLELDLSLHYRVVFAHYTVKLTMLLTPRKSMTQG